MVLACAGPPRREVRPSRRAVPQLPVEVTEADLGQARVLLEKARPELETRQWELLNEKLLAAERARERYESSRSKDQPRAKPPPPAMGLAGGGAAAVEGASLAPLLVLLAAFWSADTAGPGMDPPRWQGPLLDYEGKLRELSEAAKQVQAEIEASRGRRKKQVPDRPPAPKVESREDVWVPVEGEPDWRPCFWKGVGGGGAYSSKPTSGVIRCTYMCGKYEVTLYVFGRREEDCELRRNLDQAEEAAKRRALR